jgi:SAM-dependent methyltransferase
MNYRERIYERYSSVCKKTGSVFSETEARKYADVYSRRLDGWLPQQKDAKILDLGCGSGRMLFFLSKAGYSYVSGVDFSEEQVLLARQVTDNVAQGDFFEFIRGKIEEYDLILAQNIIEHLSKDGAFELLDSCLRALRPGGRLILSTPNAESPMFSSRRYGDFTHEICFTPPMLGQILEIVGFEGIALREMGPYCHGLISGIRRFLWSLIRRLIQLYNLVEVGHSASGVYTRDFLISGVKPPQHEGR